MWQCAVAELRVLQRVRAAMTEVDTTNCVNAYCDSLVAKVTPATRHHLEQFLAVLLAHIKEGK